MNDRQGHDRGRASRLTRGAVVCATVTAALVFPGGPARAQGPGTGTLLVTETFKGATAPEFTGFGKACLTGAPLETTPLPPHAPHVLEGCDPKNVPLPPPTEGFVDPGEVPPAGAAPDYGYLRLTDAWHNRTAAALYDTPLPANGGLDVTFDVWQYGGRPFPSYGNRGDGVSFFLTDGAAELTHPGAFGGSLGYAQKYHHQEPVGWEEGVEDGYLGVGLDTFGNYVADTEQRGYKCDRRSPIWDPTSDAREGLQGPNMVTLRGPGKEDEEGKWLEGYCYITATSPQWNYPVASSLPMPSDLPGQLRGPLRAHTGSITDMSGAEASYVLEPAGRRVNIHLTPAPNPRLTVSMNFGDGWETLPNMDNIPAPAPVPRTYKFGFAASTGDATDVHLIRNVVVRSAEPLPRLNLVKQVERPLPEHFGEGDVVTYEYVLTNSGPGTITDLDVVDNPVGQVCHGVTELPVGTITCTATYEITAEDVERGYIKDIATATGMDPDGNPVESPPSEELLDLTGRGLVISKSVREDSYRGPGEVLHYTYTVTNTGTETLYDVKVIDPKARTLLGCERAELPPWPDPRYEYTCIGTYVTTADDVDEAAVVNIAHAEGYGGPERQTQVESEPRQTAVPNVGGHGPFPPGGKPGKRPCCGVNVNANARARASASANANGPVIARPWASASGNSAYVNSNASGSAYAPSFAFGGGATARSTATKDVMSGSP